MALTEAAAIGLRREFASSRDAARPMVPLLRWERRTAVVGLVATAIGFGPARMAFGMLLPSMRETFALSGSTAGTIKSASFGAFALALVAASLATRTVGAKLPVVLSGVLALAGAAIVALASSTAWLAAGAVLAAMAAGLCWTPFNAVAGRLVRQRRRDRVLSIVSTGTALGIAVMALGALALVWTGASWRLVWSATAAGGAMVALLAYASLPPSRRLVPRHPPDVPALDLPEMVRRLARRGAWPLYAAAFGTVSSAFATFAVDHVVSAAAEGAGTTPENGTIALTAGGLVFLAYGTLGAAGFLTDAIERALGFAATMAACFVAAAIGTAAVALAPGIWPLACLGAGLAGASVMVFAVLMSIGSLRVVPTLPVMGLTVAVVVMSLGSVAGPIVTGMIADTYGMAPALLLGAGLSMIAGASIALGSIGAGGTRMIR